VSQQTLPRSAISGCQGCRRTFQVVPFHSSDSGERTWLTVRYPTARQNAVTQETLLSFDPGPADTGCAGLNCRPFQAKNPARPEVMQLVLLAQDNVPGRKQAPPQVAAGQGRRAEEVMFFQIPELASYEATYALGLAASPMVRQNAPVQETADGIVTTCFAGRGGSAICQLLPFHTAALGSARPRRVVVKPTATHVVALAQERPGHRTPTADDGRSWCLSTTSRSGHSRSRRRRHDMPRCAIPQHGSLGSADSGGHAERARRAGHPGQPASGRIIKLTPDAVPPDPRHGCRVRVTGAHRHAPARRQA